MIDWISCAVTRPCESSIAVSIIDSVNDFTPYPNSRRFRISVANNRSSRSPSSTYGSISSAKFACVMEKIPSLCHSVSSPSNATSSITPQRLGAVRLRVGREILDHARSDEPSKPLTEHVGQPPSLGAVARPHRVREPVDVDGSDVERRGARRERVVVVVDPWSVTGRRGMRNVVARGDYGKNH